MSKRPEVHQGQPTVRHAAGGGALGVIRARPVRRQCCCSSDQAIDPGRVGDGCSRVEGIAWVDVCATPSHSMSC